jgi:protein MAK11
LLTCCLPARIILPTHPQGDKDLGFLMSPGEGAVTALAFFAPAGAYSPTHLLSGCADGTLSVWSAGGGWECMKTLRGHRKDISAISVHPSGMVALTVSRCVSVHAALSPVGLPARCM